jgi:hypothetical protein
MAADYKIILRTAAGVKVAEISDHLWLSYTKRVNEPGLCRFLLRGDHGAIPLLAHNGQVEVRRRDSTGWATDYYGLYRGLNQKRSAQETFEAYCPGQMTWLADEVVGYTADTTNRNKFTSAKAETVMRSLVRYNCTSAATTGDGRLYTTSLSGISVASDGLRGSTIDWACAWVNVLAELQKVAASTNTYFDLVKTGAATWEWNFYPTQPGTDRSADVVFSLGFDNMADLQFTLDRSQEKTVALVAGEGREADRQTTLVYSSAWSATNHKVLFVDASSAKTAAARTAAGNAALDKAKARGVLKFNPRQTQGCRYGVHYFVGDLVGYDYLGYSGTQLVAGVSVEATPEGLEKINVELRDV